MGNWVVTAVVSDAKNLFVHVHWAVCRQYDAYVTLQDQNFKHLLYTYGEIVLLLKITLKIFPCSLHYV